MAIYGVEGLGIFTIGEMVSSSKCFDEQRKAVRLIGMRRKSSFGIFERGGKKQTRRREKNEEYLRRSEVLEYMLSDIFFRTISIAD